MATNSNKLIQAVLLLLTFLLFFYIGWRCHPSPKGNGEPVIVRDTVTLYDTAWFPEPVYLTERVVDTMYVPVTETEYLHDTAYIAIPRVQRVYADSLYRAWVSGYDPKLDSLAIYQQTHYITTTIRPPEKKWHVGISAGYGASKDGLSTYIGVGVTYSLFGF